MTKKNFTNYVYNEYFYLEIGPIELYYYYLLGLFQFIINMK